jgi:hypothetical protein
MREASADGIGVRRHPTALAAILAVEAGRVITRDNLMALLWPDADAEQARKRLRVALHALRQALGRDAVVSGGRPAARSPRSTATSPHSRRHSRPGDTSWPSRPTVGLSWMGSTCPIRSSPRQPPAYRLPCNVPPEGRAQVARLYLLTGQGTESEKLYRALAAEQPDVLTWRTHLAVLGFAVVTGVKPRDSRKSWRHSIARTSSVRTITSTQSSQRSSAGRNRLCACCVMHFAHGWAGDLGGVHREGLHRDPLLEPLRGFAPFQELLRPRK